MKNIMITTAILAVIITGIYFIYSKEGEVFLNDNNATTTNSTSTSTPTSEENGTTTGTVKYTVGGIEYELFEDSTISTFTLEKLNLETLNKELVFPSNNPVEITTKYETDIKKILSSLDKNPLDFDKWIELGVYRKVIGDYEGAITAWINASVIEPQNALPESNIGNVLGYYMKDPLNAEKHYLKSIEIEPNTGFWYYQAFMFYREVLKNEAKAKAIIEKGVLNNPNDIELKDILDVL